MEFEDNDATRLTEKIMGKIKEHLQHDEPLHAHHYNRTYEAIHDVLSEAVPVIATGRHV